MAGGGASGAQPTTVPAIAPGAGAGGPGAAAVDIRAGFKTKASGRKGHDELRKFQVSQPLRPVVAKWPTKMTPEDKALFKAHAPAMHLLVKLGYVNGTDW